MNKNLSLKTRVATENINANLLLLSYGISKEIKQVILRIKN